jgi:hypothetical protein
VNFLSDLDKIEAELFSKLCGFGCVIGDLVPLVFDVQAPVYNKQGINFASLSHLESIGLIQFNSVAGFRRVKLPKTFSVYYYGELLPLEMRNETDNQLDIGKALLTRIGRELAPISGSMPVEGFYDYLRNRWNQYMPKPQTAQTAESGGGSHDPAPPDKGG